MKIPVDVCPAGPEMDIAIANASNFAVFQKFGSWYIASDIEALQDGMSSGLFFESGIKGDSVRFCFPLPQYSRYLADTRLIIKAVLENGYVLTWQNGGWIIGKLEIWYGWDWDDTGIEIEPLASGDTVSLAVSRAFLKAKDITEIETDFTDAGKNGLDEEADDY